MQPRVAVAIRSVLVLEGGAHLRPSRQAAVMMDTTVDGSYATAVHREATKTTAHPHGTNRPATFRMVNEMVAVSAAVGHKSHAETIEVRLGHARGVRARARDPAAPRVHQTAGLAAVATIHAAHSVYSSMEARDKRHEEVMKGEMSPEEARKRKNKARIQDAAAIGIAALGIKGAYSEWQEVQENRQELAEQQEERKKRHEKRMRKLEKQARPGGGRSRSEAPDRRRDRSY